MLLCSQKRNQVEKKLYYVHLIPGNLIQTKTKRVLGKEYSLYEIIQFSSSHCPKSHHKPSKQSVNSIPYVGGILTNTLNAINKQSVLQNKIYRNYWHLQNKWDSPVKYQLVVLT